MKWRKLGSKKESGLEGFHKVRDREPTQDPIDVEVNDEAVPRPPDDPRKTRRAQRSAEVREARGARAKKTENLAPDGCILPDFDASKDVHIELKLPEIETSFVGPARQPDEALVGQVSETVLESPINVRSPLVRKTLASHGLNKIGDLVGRREAELLAFKGIGPATVTLLEHCLNEHGLSLDEEGMAGKDPNPDGDPFLVQATATRVEAAWKQARDGAPRVGLKRLREAIELRLAAILCNQDPRWQPSSAITALRRLLRERQISSETHSSLLRTVSACMHHASARNDAPLPSLEPIFDEARAGLDALQANLGDGLEQGA